MSVVSVVYYVLFCEWHSTFRGLFQPNLSVSYTCKEKVLPSVSTGGATYVLCIHLKLLCVVTVQALRKAPSRLCTAPVKTENVRA